VLRERFAVLGRVLANPRLRRVELAFLNFGCAEYGVWVAVLVYAYQRGGATLSAAIAVLQLLPAAIVAPIAAAVADRRGGAFALRLSYLLQALSVAVTAAAMLLGAPSPVAYAGAVIAASAVTLTRPAQGALLPRLVDTPRQLIAANVVSGWVESASLLIGPAATGAMIALDGSGAALALWAVALAISALMVAGLDATGTAPEQEDEPEEQFTAAAGAVLRLARATPGLPAVIGVLVLQFIAMGAIDVLVVVLAIKALAFGASGAGYLDSSFGAGAVIGALGAIAMVGARRLAGAAVVAVIVWGAAFIVLGTWTTIAGSFAVLAAAGASHTVLDVSGRTILHRVVPPQFHGRMFGVLEGLSMFGLAIGSLSVPLLVGVGGVRTALIGIGALLLVAALAALIPLGRLEQTAPVPELQLGLVRRAPLFAILSGPVLEDLARALVARPAAAGEAIVREGELGDRFYLVGEGTLDVTASGRHLRTLEPGDGFGEIALMRDGIRTATVTAREPVVLYELGRAHFLEAVSGNRLAHSAAEELVSSRLAPSAE
jgi:hypothetical protein